MDQYQHQYSIFIYLFRWETKGCHIKIHRIQWLWWDLLNENLLLSQWLLGIKRIDLCDLFCWVVHLNYPTMFKPEKSTCLLKVTVQFDTVDCSQSFRDALGKSAYKIKFKVNKTLKHSLMWEHFFLHHIRQAFISSVGSTMVHASTVERVWRREHLCLFALPAQCLLHTSRKLTLASDSAHRRLNTQYGISATEGLCRNILTNGSLMMSWSSDHCCIYLTWLVQGNINFLTGCTQVLWSQVCRFPSSLIWCFPRKRSQRKTTKRKTLLT